MPSIHGRSGAALRERVGSVAQVARIDSFMELDGVAFGARRLRIVNGGGLEIELHPDRALDIGRVTINGVAVAWLAAPGMTGPATTRQMGTEWLQTFGGGLLATCGLDSFGPPVDDEYGHAGMHGSIGHMRATVLRAEVTDDEVIVEAEVRQSVVFGENLVLRRKVSSPLGSDEFQIEDTVTNLSYRDQPHMILYHFNLGWPLVDDDTTIDIPSSGVSPRDADAEAGLSEHHAWGPPIAGFREQVYRHDLPQQSAVTAVVANPARGLTAEITVDPSELPAIFQWKMQAQGHYVLGIEPTNTPNVRGRAAAKAAGDLPMLAPGESATYSLHLRLAQDPPVVPAPRKEQSV
jgi:hypothetical protein